MALLAQLTFESGALTGSDAFTSTGGGMALNSATPILGSYSVTAGAGGSQDIGSKTAAMGTTWALAFYFRVETVPSADSAILQMTDASLNRVFVNLRSDGRLSINSDGAQLSPVLTAGTVYRLEIVNSGSGMLAYLATEDGASTLFATLSQVTQSIATFRVGTLTTFGTSSVTFDQIHLRDDATIPTLPALSGGPAADEVALRAGVISGSRIAVNVNRNTAVRSGVVAGSRISITAQANVPFALRSGVIAGSRIAISVEAPSDVSIAARAGVTVGSRIAINVDVPVAIRSGVIVGTRAGITTLADGAVGLRSGVVVGSRIAISVAVPVAIRSGVIVGTRQALQLYRNVAIRSGVIVGSRDAYVGPGTGVVAAGQRFHVNDIREGDSFQVWRPWGGIEGSMTLDHVKSRAIRDELDEQDLTLQPIPQPDPRLVPSQAGGGRPGLKPATTATRRVTRAQRDIDRIERNRR